VFTVHPITSLDLPELLPYRTMRRQMEQRQQGIFVAEGEKVVRRLFESAFGVVSALMPEEWVGRLESLLRARSENVSVYVARKSLLETLTGFSMYQGLLAVGKIPAARSLHEILDRSPSPWLLAAVENLSNAENLGAIVRNCAAFNAHALLVSETSSSPFLRRAVRSSMGTIFRLPVVEMGAASIQYSGSRVQPAPRPERTSDEQPRTLRDALDALKARGVRCIAAHPRVEGRTLKQTEFAADSCIIFGSEGHGISREVLEMCDDSAAIAMPEGVDSLNVASAAAVFLYEANRQRARKQA
jgi:tRNA G18 (ribose-2'-O)-methylase SpoU